MGFYIKFSVHRNPLKDAEGKETYQVRHKTDTTIDKNEFLKSLEHNYIRPEIMESALRVLQRGIVSQLIENRRLHIGGLGTFYLKLGFRKRYDEQGQEVKPHFTDPKKITGNDVIIDSVGFTPDKEFMNLFGKYGFHFVNATGRGNVGHSAHYTEEQMKMMLDQYFETHDYITRTAMQGLFGLTKYMAVKWLEHLTTQPTPFLEGRKIGQTVAYYRSKTAEETETTSVDDNIQVRC
ncbi:MAG: hypothetical protein IKH99_02565 [Prevotella sp.]|nr:hypothetical protein [Prevotella sp.]